ncbi:AMP-binding protein [Nocardia sp. NPDC046763]|uniref:AMP-binding protein n=1 Tax=Nocardia sp. NPDC046763 TaxID=3155256 RepID=UPI0033F26AAE
MELHPATVWESLADAQPDRLALVQGETRRSWREFDQRAARLSAALAAAGVGPGSKVGLMLHNSIEFLETYFAVLKIRAVPFNINFRYTADELTYLLTDTEAHALVYHSSLANVVATALTRPHWLTSVLEVDDGGPGLPTSLGYEQAISMYEPQPRCVRSDTDITLLYTGGTTGKPKGVITPLGPALRFLLAAVPPLLEQQPITAPEHIAALAHRARAAGRTLVSLPASPLVHGTGINLGAVPALTFGGTVTMLQSRGFDAGEVWATVERDQVSSLAIVGDAFARPLLEALRSGPHRDLSSLRLITSSGAMFSSPVKEALLQHLPHTIIHDLVSASEGTMGISFSTAGQPVTTGRFTRYLLGGPDTGPRSPGPV